MNKDFDIGIVGVGVAGAFACLKLAQDYPDQKVIAFDLGRPPAKRRGQLDGFLGCLPNSDGKLYQNDLLEVANLIGMRKAKKAQTFVMNAFNQVGQYTLTKDKKPLISLEKKFKKLGYEITLNNYTQLFSKEIHLLSRYMTNLYEQDTNLHFVFDQEIVGVSKQRKYFTIATEDQEYRCKKLIIAAGRAGWRWVKTIFDQFGIIEENDTARFGIRIEANSSVFKDFNKSNCSIKKGDELEIGPLSWYGTVIPEDHLDMAISSFRSNEARWNTDKVSFNLIGNRSYPKTGMEQTNRLGQLTFVLTNDRISKERVSTILNGRSVISIIPEYDWLKSTIKELAQIIPEITTKSYFHTPTILPIVPKTILGDNLESEVEGLFVIGESAGIHGLLAAACMGVHVAESVAK